MISLLHLSSSTLCRSLCSCSAMLFLALLFPALLALLLPFLSLVRNNIEAYGEHEWGKKS